MRIVSKSLTYRVYAYLVSFAILCWLTGEPPKAAGFSLVLELVKLLQYGGFEWAWQTVVDWHRPLAKHLVLKSALYRLVSFGIAFFLFSLLTLEVKTAARFAFATEFVKFFQYYVFERLWRSHQPV